MLADFLLLPKFSDFVNSDDYIGKNHIKIFQTMSSFYSKINLDLIKKGITSSEKIRNSGIYIYDYAHSFFGKDF